MLFMNSWKIWESKCSEVTDIIFTHLHWDHVYLSGPLCKMLFFMFEGDREYQFSAVNPIPLYYKSYEYPVLGLENLSLTARL